MAVNVLASLVFGFLAGFLFAFGIGANDVANNFATSIGSGAITLIKAFVLASICEIIGALLLGDGVATEISQGVINIHLFDDQLDKLILGYLSALVSSTLWLVVAAAFKMPVSATQTAIGAMVGMSIAAFGFTSVNVNAVLKIFLSWLVTPIMAGVVSVSIYVILRMRIFHLPSVKLQLGRCLFVLPFLYFLTIAVNIFICLLEKPTFMPSSMSWSAWIPATIGISIGVIFAILVAFIYIPYLRKSVKDQSFFEKRSPSQEITESDQVQLMKQSHCENFMEAEEFDDIGPLFWVLQVLASCFSSVAHGGNDVANAIVPIMAMMEIYSTGQVPSEDLSTPVWLLVLGGSGMTVGLWAMGRRVVETLGSNLAHLTSPKVFKHPFQRQTNNLLQTLEFLH